MLVGASPKQKIEGGNATQEQITRLKQYNIPADLKCSRLLPFVLLMPFKSKNSASIYKPERNFLGPLIAEICTADLNVSSSCS